MKDWLSAGHLVVIFLVFFLAFGLGFFFQRTKTLKRLVHDEVSCSIRGSFINFCFTVMVAILIGVGAFREAVASNLMKMETLIIGTFAASFGIYSLKQGYSAYEQRKSSEVQLRSEEVKLEVIKLKNGG